MITKSGNLNKRKPVTQETVNSYDKLLNNKTVEQKMDDLWVESATPKVLPTAQKGLTQEQIKNNKNTFTTLPKQTIGNKIGNFFNMTLPTAVSDLWDDIKEPFVGKSDSQLLKEAKLSPKLIVEDVEKGLAKENPTREDYALVKPAQDIIKKYGTETSNIRALPEDNTELVKKLERAEKTWQVSPVDAAVSNVGAAGASIFGNLASMANSIGADQVPVLKNITNFAVEGARKAQENAQQYNVGNYGEALGTVTQGVVNLVPYFVLGTGGKVVQGVEKVSKYGKYIEPIIKNPSFWYSLTSMWGQKYQEKIDEGNGRFESLANALLYAIPASLVEVSGGIGAKGKETQSLLRTIGEEIAEELVQDVISGTSDKATTNHDLPIFSMDPSEEAIINPTRMAKTAAYTLPITFIGAGSARTLSNISAQQAANRQANIETQAKIDSELENLRSTQEYQRVQTPKILPKDIQALKKYSAPLQQANLAQNQANEQQNIETQQTTQPNQNNAKNQLKNDINNLNISQDEKQNLIETLNSTELNTDVNSNTTENKYISPLTNIQEATDFVSKASTNDINTLKQMLQEVEKNPNRIDLQFFAEKVKKKIEYLTKSQSYQRNKAATLVKSLKKTYGLDGKLVKEALNKYIETYNEGGDISEARKTFLNTLNPNALLGKDASNKINRDIDNFNKELDTIKRYDEDRIKTQEAKERNKQIANTSKEEVAELYKQKKTYQTAADKAMQRILLTKSDGVQLDRLLKGEITFDQLPKGANVDQIRKAYDVKKPLADVNKQIQDYNKAVKEQRNEKMRELTKNSAKWKDKNTGLSYAMETQERNISDIAPAEDAQRINKEIFEPIHHNEAQATRYKNGMRDKIKSLNIGIKPKYEVTYEDSQGTKTEKVSESGLVQLYGEGKIDDKVLNKLDVDTEKIKKSVSTFREIYNDLYNKTNDVLVKNGYAPVEFRKDYFPHFEETKPDTLVGKALTKLGFKMDTRELPTDIAGLTHTFKPGKKWVSNFLQRTTDVATYDAIKGFDSYIDSVADVIYHTDDIQNLRAYENALRYQHSEEVIKEQVDEIINMDIANEMKQSMIDQLYATAENSLAHYVTDLRAYTDNLAGKKTLEDRTMEHNLGRGIYNVTKNVQSRVSANMVGANISSALTNFIPLTQASAVIDTGNLLQSTWDTIKSAVKSDGFAEQSDFLTNRRGSDKLYKTATDKLSDVTNLMSLFDNFTSEVINRGRYYQNVANGMNEADARLEADKMTGNIMADRSKGSSPTLFNQSSPVTKLLTAFQLEVNNQYSYLFKDIPKEYKDKAIGKMVWAFAKMFIGAWLYNELYERMTGRRAALDPIDIVAETVGDVKEGKKASEVASGLATQVVEDIPFVGGLIGGGRLPISNALPNVGEVAKSGISLFEEGDKTKALKTIGSEMLKPVFYILPPFGGGQVKKSIEGITTYAKGGSYGVNAQGEETLKYPVEQTPGNLVKSALFGKYATEGAKNWVDSGFKSLSANQTEFYEKAKKAKIPDKLFYAAKDSQKGIEGLGDLTSLAKKNAIDRATPGLTLEKRKILYDAFNVAKSEWENTTILTPQEIQKKKLEEEKKQEEKKKKEGK